jgi:arginyl-tRNA synthetase
MDEKGLLKISDGATICFLDGFQIPLIVKKSDGGYGYDSTDMAAISYRLRDLHCDEIIYVTDAGQELHFRMVIAAAQAAGWIGPGKRVDHVGFGVVQGDDGKKFKTRSGETVRLVDLLDEAVRRMEANLRERKAEGKCLLSDEEIHSTAAAIGYGAVKYFDLRQNPATEYIFSYERMLDTRGNTAVYILFAYARIQSILRKALEADEAALDFSAFITLEHDAERQLSFTLLQFEDVISQFQGDLVPTRICDLLYSLAVRFSDFVTNCRVLQSPEQASRLLLCTAVKSTMKTCLELLGITPIDRI